MKNIHVYNIMSESGERLMDLMIPMEGEFTYLDVFEKVEQNYFEVDSYSYSVIE
jgi:hypothetical protein